MKAFNRAIDRFCFKYDRYGIRNLMLIIVAGNVLVFLLEMMDRTGTLIGYLYFMPGEVLRGQVWRLVTFIFIPDSSNLLFMAIALYFYYIIGSALEREWGSMKFTLYYLFGMLFTIVYGLAIALATGYGGFTIGSYYLNLSLFFAFATLYPEHEVLVFFILPVKMKWLAWISAALTLWGIITSTFPYNLLPVAALLNYLLFFSDTLIGALRNIRYRYSKNTVRFKSSVRKAKIVKNVKMYTHKCTVCGKTDTEYPDMEFRYCSKCKGYHCYCMDHINNHTHIT